MAQPQRLTERIFLEDPMEWPRWPLLPLKKRRGDFHADDFAGFLFAEGKPKVYIGTIFGIRGEKGQKWSEVLADHQVVEYSDFDDLLAVWEVD